MGFFKDLKKTYDMSQEVSENWDPSAQAQGGVESMKQANAMMAEQAETMRLATDGVDASATIVAVQQGTAMVNFQPTVHIEMTISRDGMPPYPAQATQIVPQVQLSMLEPGKTVCVKVAKDDPQKVWVDLSRPAPSA